MRCNNELITCRNVATKHGYCDQHQKVFNIVYMGEVETETVATSPDVLPITPAQKAAATRIKNKAAKLEALKKEIDDLDVADD